MEFPNTDFPNMVGRAYSSRGEDSWERARNDLLPTGYEDFLRALGFQLDQRTAEAVSIAEFEDIVVVGGIGKAEAYESSQIKPFHLILRGEDVEFMLNQAFRRRAPEPETPPRGGLRRFF